MQRPLPAERLDHPLQRGALRGSTDRAHHKQEVDREQLAHQPPHILRRGLQLLGQLLLEVLPGPQQRIIKKPVSEVLQIRNRPDRAIVEEQRPTLN